MKARAREERTKRSKMNSTMKNAPVGMIDSLGYLRCAKCSKDNGKLDGSPVFHDQGSVSHVYEACDSCNTILGTGRPPSMTYCFGDDENVTYHHYASCDAEAAALVEDIQSLAGSNLERDGDFVYVVLDAELFEMAEKELAQIGYGSEEGW